MTGVRGVAKRWFGAVLTVLGMVGLMMGVRCDTRSLPVFIQGVDVTGNEPPTLTILRPSSDVSINQGDGLVIEWVDTDRDSDARISFSLVGIDDPSIVIPLVEGIQESEDGGASDRFTASTGFVPLGTFNLRGRIDDGVNRPVSALATNRVGGTGAVVVRVVLPGTARQNNPPQVFVRDPGFNLSVSQDDTVTVVVQPTSRDPNIDPNLGPMIDDPFDDDSTTLLYVVLDLDNNPLNDDVIAADPTKLIVLTDPPIELVSTEFAAITFQFPIDLESVPLRADGKPYFIRATITDGQNAPVHSYAAGTLNVVRAVSSPVNDLAQVGKTTAGVRFVGFNPGSRLGTRMINVLDFDLDGIDDFMLVAQFGNPRNFGNIGEAYLIYGLSRQRFGGFINVNSTATAIPGVIFEASPARRAFRCGGSINVIIPRTDGITDVAYIPDLNGDNRPELLFGCAHVDGVFTTRDDDPGDDPPTGDETLMIELLVHQGLSELTLEAQPDDIVTDFTYLGMEDVVISSAEPSTNFRSGDIEWVNGGPNNRKWTLLKFKNIISTFPIDDQNRLDRISDITGDLVLTILERGGPATVHELFRDFDEATTTFANFGEPIANIDYDEDELGTIDADESGAQVTISLDGSGQLQRLIFGLLAGVNNELRFIIVPSDDDEDAFNLASAQSKEFGTADNPFRPTLDFDFSRELQGGPLGCYPDNLPNNFSDDGNEDAGCNERKFEALGFVALLHSTNRDASARRNPDRLSDTFLDRLTDTVVSLELVGMRPAFPLESGISAVEQAIGDEADRTEGIRFTAGWYDFFDHLQLGQPPLNGLFGQSVSWMPDVNLDGFPEVIISSPRNERDLLDMLTIPDSTHASAHRHNGSITIIPGTDFDVDFFRDKAGAETGTTSIPWPEDQNANSACPDPGSCSPPGFGRCGPFIESGTWEVFAEHPDDFLGGARSPGDFNLDTVPDLICGAPGNDRTSELVDSGAMYVIYGRSPVGNVRLADADDPRTRSPMLRVRGETPGDRIGWKQEPVQDVNGDRIDDVLFSSPTADFIVPKPECIDFTSESFLDANLFNACRNQEVFLDDTCKQFDYNNDRVVDDDDREVFDCVQADGGNECCPVDNGYIGIIFGGVDRQGDRVISQLGTDEFSGVVFYGTHAGDRAGFDISSAGDFDQDGFGDILISAPGELRVDENGRQRMGVTYLIYGGPHLENQEVPIELSEIGDSIPGMVFLSPYESGAPDEAPTDGVGFVGDINDDGFSDIAISASMADLLDDEFPQGDGSDNDVGRRPDQGDIYIIYGNNINR